MIRDSLLYWEIDEWDYKKYNAYNQKKELLGHLKVGRIGKHAHWLWVQEPNTFMSPGCVEAVRKKQKILYKTRKIGGIEQ